MRSYFITLTLTIAFVFSGSIVPAVGESVVSSHAKLTIHSFPNPVVPLCKG